MVDRNGAWRSAENAGNGVADDGREVPPLLFPGADSPDGPSIGVGGQPITDCAGHGPERIADEVGGRLEDGEFVSPSKQWIHGSSRAS